MVSEEEKYQQDLKRYQQELITYKKQLVDQIYQSGRALDTSVLIVITGALVISIGLIDKFHSSFEVYILGASWGVLIVALASHIFSHWFSILSFKRQRDLVENSNLENGKNPFSRLVNGSNYCTRICMFLGILCLALCAFSKFNVSEKETNECVCKCEVCKKEQNMSDNNEKPGAGLVPAPAPKKPIPVPSKGGGHQKKGGINPDKGPTAPKPPAQKK